MKHTYQVVSEKTVEITALQFVKKYLRQVNVWNDEYDFYVEDTFARGDGFLIRKFSLPKKLFSMDITKFNHENDRTQVLIRHMASVIEENYKSY
ncbi:hypothetical protein HPMBJEAJ_00107 [Aeromonas phage avDM6]|nr:hypothetical protein HPMBJEAJ_00107 [Aeromonas phage avDM6]